FSRCPYYDSQSELHGTKRRPARWNTSVSLSNYRRFGFCGDRTGGAYLGNLYLAVRSSCGSLLLRPASFVIIRGHFLVALGTEAHRAARNGLPSRLHGSSDLGT